MPFEVLLKNSAREKRRAAIAARGRRAVTNYKAGKTFEGIDALKQMVDKERSKDAKKLAIINGK